MAAVIQPVIPENITVHLGAPGSDAGNITAIPHIGNSLIRRIHINDIPLTCCFQYFPIILCGKFHFIFQHTGNAPYIIRQGFWACPVAPFVRRLVEFAVSSVSDRAFHATRQKIEHILRRLFPLIKQFAHMVVMLHTSSGIIKLPVP